MSSSLTYSEAKALIAAAQRVIQEAAQIKYLQMNHPNLWEAILSLTGVLSDVKCQNKRRHDHNPIRRYGDDITTVGNSEGI